MLRIGKLVDLLAGDTNLLHDLELVLETSVLGNDLAFLGDNLGGVDTLSNWGLLQVQLLDLRDLGFYKAKEIALISFILSREYLQMRVEKSKSLRSGTM